MCRCRMQDLSVHHAEGDNLYGKLRNVDKANDQSLQCDLFPTAKAIRCINDPSVSRSSRARCDVTDTVMQYQELIKNARATTMDINQILETLSYFHVLKKLERPWSQEILFVCSCDRFYKNGHCEHSIITSMMLNKNIEIPATCCIKKPRAVPKAALMEGAQVAGSSSEDVSADEEHRGTTTLEPVQVPPSPPTTPQPHHTDIW